MDLLVKGKHLCLAPHHTGYVLTPCLIYHAPSRPHLLSHQLVVYHARHPITKPIPTITYFLSLCFPSPHISWRPCYWFRLLSHPK